MDSTGQGHAEVCDRRSPVTENGSYQGPRFARLFERWKPRQSRISQHLADLAGAGAGEDSPSTITKSVETLSINDTRDGPRELETQTVEVTIATAAHVLRIRLCQNSKLPPNFAIVIVPIVQDAPRKDHAVDHVVDQAEPVDGTGGNRTSTCSNSNSRNLAFPSSAANKNQGNSKRQRGKNNRGEPPGRRGGGKRSPAARQGDESQQPLFICPFYCSERIKHWHCHRFAFKRIGDLRQHIRRSHIPPIHCPICGMEFTRDILRDNHINAQTCQHHDFPHSWATVEQLDSMDRAANESSPHSPAERWFIIWDIMFPGTQQPASPYITDTYRGFQVSVTQDAVNEYRRQERYQQVTGQQTYLGDIILDDLLSFIYENSVSLAPATPHPSHPSNHSTTLLDPLESFPQSTIPLILSQTPQMDMPSFSQNQTLDFTSSLPTNTYQTPFFTINESLDENPDDEFENIYNYMPQPGGQDNSQYRGSE